MFLVSCRGNLFFLSAYQRDECAQKAESLTRWHERLGHLDIGKLVHKVDALQLSDKRDDPCESCEKLKAKRVAVSKQWGTRAEKPLDIVHMVGSLNDVSVDGYKYGIGFVDSYRGMLRSFSW